MSGKVRAAGLYDFCNFNDDIRNRAKIFQQNVAQIFELEEQQKLELWHGYRGVSQDGFPIIGVSQIYQNLYYF